MNITLYCSSSDDLAEEIKKATARLADVLIENGHTLICGGGNGGLMKVLADSAQRLSSEIIGVMPEFMQVNGWANSGIQKFVTTKTLAERKQFLIDQGDVFIVLPGGFGTLEEFIDTLVLKKLGQLDKPILVYNLNGFYSSLLSTFTEWESNSVITPKDQELYSVVRNLDQILDRLNELG